MFCQEMEKRHSQELAMLNNFLNYPTESRSYSQEPVCIVLHSGYLLLIWWHVWGCLPINFTTSLSVSSRVAISTNLLLKVGICWVPILWGRFMARFWVRQWEILYSLYSQEKPEQRDGNGWKTVSRESKLLTERWLCQAVPYKRLRLVFSERLHI